MNTCERYQSQLLHFVYDAAENAAELNAHLASCSECQAALAKARMQRSLLTQAAKGDFSSFRFQTPSAETLPMPSPRVRSRIHWGRWFMAAAVLLVVTGFAGLGGWGWHRHHQAIVIAEHRVNRAQEQVRKFQETNQAQIQATSNDIASLRSEIVDLVKQWQTESKQAEMAWRDKDIQLTVQGPKTLQAGARNEFRINVQPRNPQVLASLPVSVRVVDPASKAELFKQTIQNKQTATIDLPADLPVTPGAQLSLEITAGKADGTAMQVKEQLPLVASHYVTHLTTDRPMYRPGDKMFFRSLTLERFSLKPADEELQIVFDIRGPKGDEVMKPLRGSNLISKDGKEPVRGPDGKVIRGIGCGEFQLAPDLPGGEYTLQVMELQNRFPAERRKFIVNRYQPPRLVKEVEFTRKSYGPGDRVEAIAKASRVESGDPLVQQPVQITLWVDGKIHGRVNQQTDHEGKVRIGMNLPANISREDASLSVQFSDQGASETLVRPVPLVLGKLHIEFFPEGGDLVAGFPSRVYFQVTNTIGKPADLKGRIVDAKGSAVAKIETFGDEKEPSLNHGMGALELTPKAGETYELVVDSPIGVKGKFVLPQAKADGVVLNIPSGVVTDKIDVKLRTARERNLLVGAYCRGRLLDQDEIVAKANADTAVSLKTMPGVSGVYRVTVFERMADKSLRPIAERLVYRKSVEELHLKIAADKDVYTPGDKVRLEIMSQNERREAAPAILLVSVIDFGILKLADEKTARTMPTHFFLTSEVRKPEDLEYADFLLSSHSKAPVALDLLLGTQGWRRFAEQNPQEFQRKNAQEATRLLAVSGQAPTTTTLSKVQSKRIDDLHATQYVALQKRLADKESFQQSLKRESQLKSQELQQAVRMAMTQVFEAEGAFSAYRRMVGRIALGVTVVALLLGGLVLLAIGVVRFANGKSLAMPFCISGACMLALVFIGSLMGVAIMVGGNDRGLRAFLGGVAEPALEKAPAVAVMKAEVADAAVGEMAVPGEMPAPGNEVLRLGKAKGFAPPPMMPLDAFNPAAEDRLMGPALLPAEPDGKKDMAFDMAFREEMPAGAMPAGGLAARRRIQPLLAEAELRRRGDFKALARQDLQRDVALPQTPEPFVLREYAHQHVPSGDQFRRDFTETLYWQPALVLADGRAQIGFDLSDSATRFQVLATGHSLDGRLGSGTLEIASRLAYSVEPKVPHEISNGDKVTIPITLINDSRNPVSANVEVDIPDENWRRPEAPPVPPRSNLPELKLNGRSRVRQFYTYQADTPREKVPVRVTAGFGPAGSDRVERSFRVVPEGFPIIGSESGLLEKSAVHTITLPETWVPGSLTCKVEVFPSSLADLQKGLEGLLREPCGCFEQSSTSNYPNVLILNYLQESKQAAPEIEQRARALLTNGYGKLTSFECMDPKETTTRRGYEWFGQTAPPHEALTAYGLLQFHDMARVYPVDPAMVKRTRDYLLAQRDGMGGFKRNPRALDSFGRAPDHVTNAYIVWSLTETGDDDVQKELTALVEQAKTSKDPYFLSLVSLGLLNRSKSAEALEILKGLKELQHKDGYLEGAKTSITGSGGRDLQIESTALSLLAWLRANRPEQFHENVDRAIRWITKQRGGHGAFGSTQSTILALKALIAHTRDQSKTAQAGTLSLHIDGVEIPARVPPIPGAVAVKGPKTPKAIVQLDFPAGIREPLVVTIPDERWLKGGKNKLVVEITNQQSALPYTLSWSYNTLQPANPANPPVELTTSLDRPNGVEGQTVKLKAVVQNKTDQGHGMTVAIIGLPAGLSLPENLEQLRDMTRLREDGTKPGLISAFEIKGRELILYWRDLAPRQKIEVDLDLICQLPGEFRGPASRAYLYYNSDLKYWVAPLAITVEVKE